MVLLLGNVPRCVCLLPTCMKSTREQKSEHSSTTSPKVNIPQLHKGGRDKRPCCISWADETQAESCEQTRQGSILCLANTSTQGIQKQDHVDKLREQKIYKKQHQVDKRYAHMNKRYARNKGESDQVNTR